MILDDDQVVKDKTDFVSRLLSEAYETYESKRRYFLSNFNTIHGQWPYYYRVALLGCDNSFQNKYLSIDLKNSIEEEFKQVQEFILENIDKFKDRTYRLSYE